MQLFKKVITLATLAVAVVADIDWTSDATLECTKENWADIKNIADQILPYAAQVLPAENVAALNAILQGATVMPDNPTDAFLRSLPTAIPTDVLDELAGSFISGCLATYGADSGSSTEAAASPTDAGSDAQTTDAATATDSAGQSYTSTDAAANTYTTTEAATTDYSSSDVPTSTPPSKCGGGY
ncbi:hypothetical protein LPJ53_005291 [Coemansia erecta]|uniref:Uncharacterized protein n=1 Tax=Coemansia erecta TaxID=147472 RepID=A0A9W7XW01_9FUNG|nr:hypothetical protein LPJ53_005291 [Coemansia erecta]